MAAAPTSVSKATGTPSAAPIGPATSVCDHPGFGVAVMKPHVGEPGRRSTGPKHPMPTASSGPAASRAATVAAIVSAGVVVGIVVLGPRSSGPVPTATTHFVPPASMPAYLRRRLAALGLLLLASLDNRCSFGTAPHCGATGPVSASPPRCARLAPTRFARQSVLFRHGAALRRHRTRICVAASLRSACSYSLRSTIGALSARRRTAAPPDPYLRRRLAALGLLLLASLDNRCSFGTAPHCGATGPVSASPPRCARLAPTRFARQSVLFRHGAALRRHLTRICVAASLRSACSYSLRSTIGALSARRRTAAPPDPFSGLRLVWRAAARSRPCRRPCPWWPS